MNLHFVLADRGGDVRYRQQGRLPRRRGGWSGLHPVEAWGARGWDGLRLGPDLPREGALDGVVASANEGRLAVDGADLANLAQPGYRRARILEVLRGRGDHDVAGMLRLQLDLVDGQAARLRPWLLAALPPGPLAEALAAWDGVASPASRGAHAFRVAHRAALSGLAPALGGRWFEGMLERSELSVWWAAALDRALDDPATWRGTAGASLREALSRVAHAVPSPWGEVQRFELPNLVLGGLPAFLGLDRGPYPLAGTIGTVCQGLSLRLGDRRVAVAPAYRFVTDLGEDAAWTQLPGGIDGRPRAPTYACWLEDHLAGRPHALRPPTAAEDLAPAP
jgi:acyl-homoserine lactone acylase PvdQ